MIRGLELEAPDTGPKRWMSTSFTLLFSFFSLSIADEADPGYDSFSIWIEDPIGNRFPFRSPRHYCMNSGKPRIKPREPFQRGISLFYSQEGHTFRTPGEYKVTVTFRISAKQVLRSNTLRVTSRPVSDKYRDLERAMASPAVTQALYYRNADLNDDTINVLQTLAGTHPDSTARGTINSVLAKHQLSVGRDAERADGEAPAASNARQLIQEAIALLPRRAHRYRKMRALLEERFS